MQGELRYSVPRPINQLTYSLIIKDDNSIDSGHGFTIETTSAPLLYIRFGDLFFDGQHYADLIGNSPSRHVQRHAHEHHSHRHVRQ